MVLRGEGSPPPAAGRMGGTVARLHGLCLDAAQDQPGGPFGRGHWLEQTVHLALDQIGEDQDQMAAFRVREVIAGPETVATRRAFLSDALTRT